MSTATVERPSAPMDPRFRARRREVARARVRKRQRWWLLVLAAAVAVVVGWSLTRSPLLDVDEVVVEGAARTPVDQVLATAGITPGQQLLGVDEAGVAEALAALPWVGQASVEVGWGGTVRLVVAERTPVATVAGADGAPLLVDAGARVLGPAGPGDAGLVALEGVAPAPAGAALDPSASDALAVAVALGPGVRTRVGAVVVGPDRQVSLRLLPGGEAWLGPATEVDAKVRALQALFAQVVDWCLVSVDLRVPDQVAVTRDQACLAPHVGAGSTPSGGGAGGTTR